MAFVMFIVGHQAAGQDSEALPSDLHVQIYDYAGVEDPTLVEATASARDIFAQAGVPTIWAVCELSDSTSACGSFYGPATLRLRIVPTAPPSLDGIDHLSFGFAVLAARGWGTVASVFWDRIERTGRAHPAGPARVLGAVMAHEAGHLLLGRRSHTGNGLMSGVWDGPTLNALARDGLRFIGWQKRAVRVAVRARVDVALRQSRVVVTDGKSRRSESANKRRSAVDVY